MPAPIVAKIGLKVGSKVAKKHPWLIPVVIAVPLLPLVLIFGLVVMAVGALNGMSSAEARAIAANAVDDGFPPALFDYYIGAGNEYGIEWQVLAAIGQQQTANGQYDEERDADHLLPILDPKIVQTHDVEINGDTTTTTFRGLFLTTQLGVEDANSPSVAIRYIAELVDEARRDNGYSEELSFQEQRDVYVDALQGLPIKGAVGDDSDSWARAIMSQAVDWSSVCSESDSGTGTATTGGLGAVGVASGPGQALSDAQLAEIGARAGLSGERLAIAIAIALGESGGNPRAHNGNRNTGDNSYGLWQINMLDSLGPARRATFGLASNEDLFDPDTNARVMYAMSNGGTNWQPWSVYKSGAYLTHLDRARAAASGAPAPSEPPGGFRGGALDQPTPVGQEGMCASSQAGSGTSVVVGDHAFPLAPDKGVVSNPGMFNSNTAATGGHPYTAYDILAEPGTAVTAFLDGTVTRVSQDRCPGRLILVTNQDTGLVVAYMHLDFANHVQVGDQVRAGQQIAIVGPAAAGCGIAHLHIDVSTPTASGGRPGCSRLNCPTANQDHFQDIGPYLFETFQALPG